MPRMSREKESKSAPKGGPKGSEFERMVAKKLSLWMSRGQRTDLFWRTAMSGGRATIGSQSGESMRAQLGDLTAVDAEGMPLTNLFVIELKHQKAVNLDSYIVKGTGPIERWWKKLCDEAHTNKRLPMLIIRQNYFPIVLITTNRAHDYLVGVHPIAMFGSRFPSRCLYLFEDVLSKADPAALPETRSGNDRGSI